jgi:hypothetical protein
VTIFLPHSPLPQVRAGREDCYRQGRT